MVGYVACYPGQGAQKEQMALDLYARYSQVRELFTLASDISGTDVLRLLTEADGPTLQKTEVAQLAITVANRSASLALAERSLPIACHAGFSLGELTAYAAAGALDDENLFRIVAKRASLMAQASKDALRIHGELGMSAVLGIGFDVVSRILQDAGSTQVFCANDNGPKQVVIAGTLAHIEQLSERIKAAGARKIVPLRVSGPFHTPFMIPAENEFGSFLQDIPFSDPVAPLYVNVSGDRVMTAAAAKSSCISQLSSPVRWTRIMQSIVDAHEVSGVLEVGPGTVLSGLWQAGGYGLSCHKAGTCEDMDTLTEETT